MNVRLAKSVPVWRKYEMAVIKHHMNQSPQVLAWDWSTVPYKHRVKFAQVGMGTHDYGLDGLAWDPATNTYVGLQAKCNLQRALSARHLGTFFHAVMRLRRVDTMNRGALYYAGDLTGQLGADVEMLSSYYNIDIVRACPVGLLGADAVVKKNIQEEAR